MSEIFSPDTNVILNKISYRIYVPNIDEGINKTQYFL